MTLTRKTLTLACFKTAPPPSEPAAVAAPLRQVTPVAPALNKADEPRKWAQQKLALTAPCDRFSETEIQHCECIALSSWENR